MVTPKQLDCGGSEKTIFLRRSTRRTRPSRRVYEEGESEYETKKTKKTNLGSPVKRIWSDEDESGAETGESGAETGQEESCAETGQESQQRTKGKELLEEDNEAGKRIEIETFGKETQDDNDDLGTLLDAFETMLSSGISDYHRKWQLEKLMNLETGIKSKLSNEWKSLCVEEIKLKIEKLLFSAKLIEAASES